MAEDSRADSSPTQPRLLERLRRAAGLAISQGGTRYRPTPTLTKGPTPTPSPCDVKGTAGHFPFYSSDGKTGPLFLGVANALVQRTYLMPFFRDIPLQLGNTAVI